METFASIRNRPTCIRGWPHSGWRAADPSEQGAKTLPFSFDIADDGAGGFALTCRSDDRVYAADSSHPSLDATYLAAEGQFGVRRAEWKVVSRS
jgi:hypothetical protein